MERVDPEHNFPDNFLIQLFIQGLQPEYSVNIQATELATLAIAINTARK